MLNIDTAFWNLSICKQGEMENFFNPVLLQLQIDKCPLHGKRECGKGDGF
jgi:hypothetical protein